MREDSEYRYNDEIVIDLREVFGILKKKIKTVFGITAVFLAVAGAYAFFWPKTYESVATLRIKEPRNITANMLNVDNINNISALVQQATSYSKILVSRSVVEPVISKYSEPDDNGILPRYEDFVKQNITTTLERNSDILTVSMKAKDPKLAQDMNLMLVNGFIQRLHKLTSSGQSETSQFLQKRVDETSEQLKLARQKIDNMKKNSDFVSPVTVADRVNQRIAAYTQKVEDNNITIRELEARLEQAKNNKAACLDLRGEDRKELRENYYALLRERNELVTKKGEGHSKVVALDKQIDSFEESMQQFLINQITLDIEKIQQKQELYKKVLLEETAKVEQLVKAKREYIRAMDDEKIAKSQNDNFIRKLKDLRVAENSVEEGVQVLDNPTFDEKPVSPKKARTLAIALVLGLICGSMYVVVKEKM